jgi:hypothetical protein
LGIAPANVNGMKHRQTRRVDLVHADAAEFAIPDDVNVIHFFNPFSGRTLTRVIDQIYCSYQRRRRKIYVIYFNHDHFDREIAGQSWIGQVFGTTFYPESQRRSMKRVHWKRPRWMSGSRRAGHVEVVAYPHRVIDLLGRRAAASAAGSPRPHP